MKGEGKAGPFVKKGDRIVRDIKENGETPVDAHSNGSEGVEKNLGRRS